MLLQEVDFVLLLQELLLLPGNLGTERHNTSLESTYSMCVCACVHVCMWGGPRETRHICRSPRPRLHDKRVDAPP